MKRIFTAILTAMLVFSGCAKDVPEDTSYITADTIQESGVLSAVYSIDFTTTTALGNISSPITETDSGYRHAVSQSGVGLLIHTGSETVTVQIPELHRKSIAQVSDGYIYLAWDTNTDVYTLFRISFDGEITAEIPADSLKPAGNAANYPGESDWFTSVDELPIAELPDGYAIVWDDTVVYTDRDFAVTSTEKLPSTVYHIRYDTVTGELWAHCNNDGWMLCNLTTDTDYLLPERFWVYKRYGSVKITAVHDGYAYGFDEFAAFRWKISDGSADGSEPAEPEEVFNFINSNLNGPILSEAFPVFTDEGPCFTVRYMLETSMDWTFCYCTPMDDVDLSKIVTLELAHAIGAQVNEAVVAFNMKNTDVRILVNDYTRFESSEGMTAQDRLRTDLETGILKPDLIVTQERNYSEIAAGMKDYFVDLHTIKGGTYSTDDIWNSVINGLEVNGKLYGMASTISNISGLVTSDKTIAADHWNVEEIMDYMETIPDGEFMVKVKDVKEFYTSDIFGQHKYNEFITIDGFKSPLYLRYLNFVNDLQTNVRQTPDTASCRDGTIHVVDNTFVDMTDLLGIMREFGVTDASELNFIGHPSVTSDAEYEGFELHFLYGITSITKHCENPDAAWRFIEQAMTTEADKLKTARDFLYQHQGIPVLREPVMEHLRSFEGVEIFFEYGTGSGVRRYDIMSDTDRQKKEGITFTLNESHADTWAALLDNAELSFVNRKHQPMLQIIQQEESAFFNGETTAENAQTALNSRINLWLAEHGWE